jgi:hypothetical protein
MRARGAYVGMLYVGVTSEIMMHDAKYKHAHIPINYRMRRTNPPAHKLSYYAPSLSSSRCVYTHDEA